MGSGGREREVRQAGCWEEEWYVMFVTLTVFHFEISPLNEDASWNMYLGMERQKCSNSEISLLNVDLLRNMDLG